SKGKGCEAGTFIYKYDEDLADSFRVHDDILSLDFYSNNGFVYLPTEANETKETLTKIPQIKAMPEGTKVFIQRLLKSLTAQPEQRPLQQNIITASCLEPLVAEFTNKRKFMPGLFRIITPRSFRDTEQYVKEGYLHP